MPKAHSTRIGAGVVAACALAAVAASPATAARPATQAEIDGIVEAVNDYTSARGYTDSRYVVDEISVSTASTSPLYAAAKVDPRPRFRATTPDPELLLRRPAAAGAPWRVIDAGDRFCSDRRVPSAVVRDLFRQICASGGKTGGGLTKTLASKRVGPLRAVLSATQGPRRGKTVPASVYLTIYRNGVEIGQPRLGATNSFVWSQLRRSRSGVVDINPSVGYVGAQVLRNPVTLYRAYQFKVTSGGLWQQVPSPASP